LQLLHEEYAQGHPEAYRYSRFCELYRQFRRAVNVCMRQSYRAGEKLFVDFAGQTIPIHDKSTGKVRKAHLFVAVLGMSNYTYAEAVDGEGLEHWIAAHVNAFEYFGGVTELLIPDNLKSGVTKPCRYEPELNPTYLDMANHYGICIIPARVARPQDKAKAEAGVLVAERWILAVLRNRKFFSLAELNGAIFTLLEKLNERPFKKLPGSRKSHFLKLDKPALRALVSPRYEYAEWRNVTVNIDYHVAFYIQHRHYHYYSVPYRFAHQAVQLRATRNTVEIYSHSKRIAAHQRSDEPGKHTTQKEHMPESHKRHLQWTPSRILSWARTIGPACAQVADTIMQRYPHPEQGFRSCLGITRLATRYGNQRVEAVCQRAVALSLESYKSIKSMLETNQDKQPLPTEKPSDSAGNQNPHIRGSNYYK
jgi:transposase